MVKVPQPTDDDSILQSAMSLLDPSGTLVPGTEAYDVIRDMTLGWIERCGPENALDMAQHFATHLAMWLKAF
jgi:hypothetical protein